MPGRTVMVVASSVTDGRCRYCGRGIVWATRASQPGLPAKTLPFNGPRPWALSTTRNDETGLVFEVWPATGLHFTTCRAMPERPKRPATAPAAEPPRHLAKRLRTLFDEVA